MLLLTKTQDDFMKKLLGVVVLSLLSSVSMAKEREFRINAGSVAGGVAVAWGIPGEKIDFEKIEESDEAVTDFVTARLSAIQNLIVDLETEKVLKVFTNEGDGEFVDFRLGGLRYGNHYSMSLAEVTVIKNSGTTAIAMIQNFKWSNHISALYMIDRQNGVKISKEELGAHQKIMTAIKAKLTKRQLKLIDVREETVSITSDFSQKNGYVNKVSITAEIPKSEEAAYGIEANVKLSYENETLAVDVASVKFKKIQY